MKQEKWIIPHLSHPGGAGTRTITGIKSRLLSYWWLQVGLPHLSWTYFASGGVGCDCRDRSHQESEGDDLLTSSSLLSSRIPYYYRKIKSSVWLAMLLSQLSIQVVLKQYIIIQILRAQPRLSRTRVDARITTINAILRQSKPKRLMRSTKRYNPSSDRRGRQEVLLQRCHMKSLMTQSNSRLPHSTGSSSVDTKELHNHGELIYRFGVIEPLSPLAICLNDYKSGKQPPSAYISRL